MELVKVNKKESLREKLDYIDDVVENEVCNGFFESRKRILIGMWEKGKVISEYRGVNSSTKYNEMSRNTGRDDKSLKKWNDLYETYPNLEDYIPIAEKDAQQWTAKALAGKESKSHVSYNSGNNEWYTPAEYIEKAKEVLEQIDLDPASNDNANKVIKAKKYYTSEDDGLQKKWSGKVWMNPPYSTELIKSFCEKFIIHFNSGDITEGITLTNNATDTEWFHIMAVHASAICFPLGRIKFWNPEKDNAAPLQGQAIMYFGDNENKFKESFEDIGVVFNAGTR